MKYYSQSVGDTRLLGSRIADLAQPGDVYALDGDLGTGKTEFVRGFTSIIGAVNVRSPSFSILNIYTTSKFPVYHFDFYRLADISELDEIGFQDYVSGDGVCLIEWGTLFPDILPMHTRVIKFVDEGVYRRSLELDFELA